MGYIAFNVKDSKIIVEKEQKIVILIGIAFLIVGAYFVMLFWPQEPSKLDDLVVCAQEARSCPDGSYVGRTGPKCEFEKCAGEVDTSNWKTYRNEEYGFEVKYPAKWNYSAMSENNRNEGFFVCFMHEKYNFEGGECRGGPSVAFQDMYFGNKEEVHDSQVFSKEFIGENDKVEIFFIEKGKKIYVECDIHDEVEFIQECNTIVSTFKFIK